MISFKRRSQKLACGVEIPCEDRISGARTGMAPVEQRIAYCELNAAIVAGLGVRPNLSVTVSGPDIGVGKLRLQIQELGTLLHRLDIKPLEILYVDDTRPPIEQQEAVVGIRSQGISNPGKGNRTLILKSGHDANLAVTLLVKFARELYCVG